MTALIVDASGARGHLLARRLVTLGISVRAIVRGRQHMIDYAQRHGSLALIQASILEMSAMLFGECVRGVDVIA